jgi:predicted metal-dependent phosphoesterase TrpH
MAIDLHVHTNASGDGQFTAQQIVEMASKIGLQTIAITDHDSVASVEAGMMWGDRYKIEVIPGCELFSQYQGRFLHILGYYIDPRNPELVGLCEEVAEDSLKRIDLQIKVLRDGGYYLEKGKVLEQCSQNTPLYSNYVQAIFEDERNKNNSVVKEYRQKDMGNIKFCRDFMSMGKVFYIPQYIPDVELVLKIIQQSGGVPILAHPAINLKEEENFIIDDLIHLGLAGLEVYTSHHTPQNEKFYQKYCNEKSLIYTCGSDFHGYFKPKVKLGEIKKNTGEVVDALKATAQKNNHNRFLAQ